MAELFRFRCYHCHKLLGASPSRIGSVVHCPKCRTELIVPPPVDDPPAPDPEDLGDPPIRLEDLGLRLDLQTEPPTKILPATDEPNPVAFLEQVAADEPSTDTGPEIPAPPDPSDPGEGSGLPEPPDPLDSPLSPRPRRARRRARPSELMEPVARRRDVVLPRTAAVAWSLFALLALACAFGSGLLVGHFLWR